MTTEPKRGPGRPRIHDWEPGRIEVRLDPALRKRARLAAVEAEMSLSEWVGRAIKHELARVPAAPKPAADAQRPGESYEDWLRRVGPATPEEAAILDDLEIRRNLPSP